MANTRSAEKRNRQAQKRRTRNVHVRSQLKTAVKKAREAITQGDAGKAKEAFTIAARAIDKAASKGVLHANNAARKISRLAKALGKPAAR